MQFVSPSGFAHNVNDSEEAKKHPGHKILKSRGWEYKGTGEGFGGNFEHHYTHPSTPKEHMVLQKIHHVNGEVENRWMRYGSKGGYKEGKNAEGLHHAAVNEEYMNEQHNRTLKVSSAIEELLKQKTKLIIEEARKQVAADTFEFERVDPTEIYERQIEAAYENTEQLNEKSEIDHPLAKELAKKALYNHHQYNSGNHDRSGGLAMHNLHIWAKNYAKKKDKGVYDKEKAVKGLTHAIKRSEPSYFGKAHHEKSGQSVSGATRTQAARHLLPHVEKMMDQHRKKKPVKEVDEAAAPSVIHQHSPIPMDRYQSAARKKGAEGQAAFNKSWHAAKGNDAKRKELKKHAFQHDFDIPDWEANQSHSKSPIHSFTEEEMNEELVPGHTLNDSQRRHVLSSFVHRHTGEHRPQWANVKRSNGENYKPTHKTDKDWVDDHAFHFNKKTGSLSAKHKYAEPNYLAIK